MAAAATAADEPVWQLPLFKEKYRKQLDSDVADLKNVGGPYGGAINAAVFLSEFVGDVPWAHLDIAGPMKVDADESGARRAPPASAPACSIDLALNFSASPAEPRRAHLAREQLAGLGRSRGRDADGDELRFEQAAIVAGGDHRRGEGVRPGEGVDVDRRRRPLLVCCDWSVVGQPAEVALRDERHPAAHEPGLVRRWTRPNITQRVHRLGER